jgi:hypothetical protein
VTLERVREPALRLLKEISEHQAGWKEGAPVHLGGAAHYVGLVPDTPLCDAAVSLLEQIGALEPHEQLGPVSVGDTYGYFRITLRGLDIANPVCTFSKQGAHLT